MIAVGEPPAAVSSICDPKEKQDVDMAETTTHDNTSTSGDSDGERLVVSAHKKRFCHSWGRGIVDDAKRTVGTHWKQEMVNLNQKTVAVSFFLFFACIAPAITFGAIYAKATNNWIGGKSSLVCYL